MANLLEETHLVNVDSGNNHNKFYRALLFDDGSVQARWGRVGADGQSKTYDGGRSAYERILREKMRKGYSKVEVTSPTTVTSAGGTDKARLKEAAAASLIADTDPVLNDLVERLVAANKHNLMTSSGGMITVDTSGQVTTPLGIISARALGEARALLSEMSQLTAGARLGDLTEQYLRLVPQKVPVTAGRGWAQSWLFELTNPQEQWDLLDALTASVSYADQARKNAEAAAASKGDPVPTDFFRYKVSLLAEDSEEYAAVVDRYRKTKQDIHTWSKLHVKRVFKLTDSKRGAEVEATAARLRNVRRLWHGTVAANVLSILQGGLIIPPTHGGSIHVTGRMFGDGIYLSRSASKSLGYSTGYWSRSSQTSAFMFLTHTAMGSEYRPQGTSWDSTIPRRARTERNEFGKPYDSINVLAGRAGVRNPESVVWDPDQVRLSYLVEFA